MVYQLSHRAKGSGFTMQGRAGQNLGSKKLVYKAADGTWMLADADSSATMSVVGITRSSIRSGMAGEILLQGFIGSAGWTWTVGGKLYASSTPGEMTQTPPMVADDLRQEVAVATKSNMVYFSPGLVGIAHEYATAYITSGGALTIDTVSVWHAVTGFANPLVSGIAFNAGSTAAITVYADAGGGQVTVTSAGHGLSNGDIITISGSTNYNAFYEITNVGVNDFEITAVWAGNDGAGTWRNGSNFVVSRTGIYKSSWQMSAQSAGNNKVYRFTMSLNDAACPQGLQRRKFAVGNDVGSVSGSCIMSLTAGDIVMFNVYGETDATNITLAEVTMNLFRIA